MVRLAVIILTKNEENNIEECIQSASFADEIVVIDSGSTDATQAKAEALGARFVVHPMDEDGFAGQRNFALTQTEAEWVFFLDADERIKADAARKIRQIVDRNEPAAYRVERHNVVFGRRMRYGAHRPDYVARLYPRTAVRWYGRVHEGIETSLTQKKIFSCLDHYTYTTWKQYFTKFNQYTTLAAESLYENNKQMSEGIALAHAVFTFIRDFVLRLGVLDGFYGLVMSIMASVYTLVKYLKLVNIERRKDKGNRGESD